MIQESRDVTLPTKVHIVKAMVFPTFSFQSPIMKRTSFLVLVLEGFLGLHRTVQLLQHYWSGHRYGLL